MMDTTCDERTGEIFHGPWTWNPADRSWFARLPGSRWAVVEADPDDPPTWDPAHPYLEENPR